ncbi:MAG: response regulator transcription factor [Leptolyngbyaceae cyanobacterium]
MSRILIAEDEPKIAAFIEKGLKRSGFMTDVAENGNAVLEKVLAENFDLLLLDLGLPGKDGMEILREIQQQGSALPIVVVTARELEPIDQQVFRLFDITIFSKPFLMKKLLQKVRELLNAESANSELDTTE